LRPSLLVLMMKFKNLKKIFLEILNSLILLIKSHTPFIYFLNALFNMKQVGEFILQLNIFNPLTITKTLKRINKFRNNSITVLLRSFRSYFDLYSTFTCPYTLKYSFLLVKMNHFFYPLDYTNILRTPYPMLENIFFRPFFALIFNFEDPHSPKYAKSS
jgi:hypothetical protein